MIEGLNEKVVIVTGGGHGIGKAYCLSFAQAGSHVVVADIDKPAADQVSAEVTQKKGPVLGHHELHRAGLCFNRNWTGELSSKAQ
jgi:NAD(P)-dependent dehydrogenase (short-subunit alcohol dehydrogenase family)